MLIVKIILCVLAVVVLFLSSFSVETLTNMVLDILGVVFIIAFSIILIITHWNLFAIPKIIVLVCVCIFARFLFQSDGDEGLKYFVLIPICIAYIIAGIFYVRNIEKCEIPEVETTRLQLVAAGDNMTTVGNLMYIHGQMEYGYYYQKENGNFVFDSIPAKCAEISYISQGEQPYLEKTTEEYYFLNTNNDPATRIGYRLEVRYIFYVPEGSIIEVFEFDAQ